MIVPFDDILSPIFVPFCIVKPPFIIALVPVMAPAEVIDAVVTPALLTFIDPPLLTLTEP